MIGSIKQDSVAGSVNQATGLLDFEDVFRTNPREGVVGPKLLAEGSKQEACCGISSCLREVDQSPTPAVFRTILGCVVRIELA